MAFDPQNYDPSVLTGRVRPNVCKIQVQSYQDSLLCPARACDRFIIRAREILVANGVGNETAPCKISATSTGRFSSILNFTP